jgi:hypothetical protein
MKQLSECCDAEVKTVTKRGVMGCDSWEQCLACGQPCDILEKEGDGDEKNLHRESV